MENRPRSQTAAKVQRQSRRASEALECKQDAVATRRDEQWCCRRAPPRDARVRQNGRRKYSWLLLSLRLDSVGLRFNWRQLLRLRQFWSNRNTVEEHGEQAEASH